MTKENMKVRIKEARLMRSYEHPNIVRWYCVTEEHEPLLMELMMPLFHAHTTSTDSLSLQILSFLHSSSSRIHVPAQFCICAPGQDFQVVASFAYSSPHPPLPRLFERIAAFYLRNVHSYRLNSYKKIDLQIFSMWEKHSILDYAPNLKFRIQ